MLTLAWRMPVVAQKRCLTDGLSAVCSADQAAKLVADHTLTRDLALLDHEDGVDTQVIAGRAGGKADGLRAAGAGGFLQGGDAVAADADGGIAFGGKHICDGLQAGVAANASDGAEGAVFDLRQQRQADKGEIRLAGGRLSCGGGDKCEGTGEKEGFQDTSLLSRGVSGGRLWGQLRWHTVGYSDAHAPIKILVLAVGNGCHQQCRQFGQWPS